MDTLDRKLEESVMEIISVFIAMGINSLSDLYLNFLPISAFIPASDEVSGHH